MQAKTGAALILRARPREARWQAIVKNKHFARLPPQPKQAIEVRSRAKPPRQPRTKAKLDPRFVSAARELRDRCLEHINTTPLLPAGKYDVSRAMAHVPAPGAGACFSTEPRPRELPHAA